MYLETQLKTELITRHEEMLTRQKRLKAAYDQVKINTGVLIVIVSMFLLLVLNQDVKIIDLYSLLAVGTRKNG